MPSVDDFMPDGVKESRLSDQAFEKIKALIIQCHLRPGSEVTESGLADLCGFGKAPIRAALARLTHQNLVKPLHRRGYLISPITMRDVNDIFQIRLYLEPDVVEAAATAPQDPDLLAKLKKLSVVEFSLKDSTSISEFLAVNREFHITIAKMTRNERLTYLIGQLLDEMERLFHIGLAPRDRSSEMRKDHMAIYEAISGNDRARAKAIATQEIEESRKMVMDAIFAESRILDMNLADL